MSILTKDYVNFLSLQSSKKLTNPNSGTGACTRVGISQLLRTLQAQKIDIIFCQDAHFIYCKNQVCIYLG